MVIISVGFLVMSLGFLSGSGNTIFLGMVIAMIGVVVELIDRKDRDR
jgi:hypothetical protein